ncbi:fructose PTS transporter subunit IIA, partial [Streptomyces sp. LB8]|uniref:PTS sugar transporter subunit IIA n=1 Tax=Streptomyces sp. LB8 TaxID=3042509 RepID=UPI00264988C9
MSDMITADLVDLDLSAGTKEAAARALAERMAAQGRVTDLEGFLADVAAREAQMPTGLDGGIGIPHCRSEHVTEPTLAFGRSATGIDFGAADGPADLIFLIAAPAGADDAHLTILSSLARRLMDGGFTSALRSVDDAEAAAALLRGEDPPAFGAPASGAPATEGPATEGPATEGPASGTSAPEAAASGASAGEAPVFGGRAQDEGSAADTADASAQDTSGTRAEGAPADTAVGGGGGAAGGGAGGGAPPAGGGGARGAAGGGG